MTPSRADRAALRPHRRFISGGFKTWPTAQTRGHRGIGMALQAAPGETREKETALLHPGARDVSTCQRQRPTHSECRTVTEARRPCRAMRMQAGTILAWYGKEDMSDEKGACPHARACTRPRAPRLCLLVPPRPCLHACAPLRSRIIFALVSRCRPRGHSGRHGSGQRQARVRDRIRVRCSRRSPTPHSFA